MRAPLSTGFGAAIGKTIGRPAPRTVEVATPLPPATSTSRKRELVCAAGLIVAGLGAATQSVSLGSVLAWVGFAVGFPFGTVGQNESRYVLLRAFAILSSANATSFRDVARFIRMWPAPPVPYDDPGFR